VPLVLVPYHELLARWQLYNVRLVVKERGYVTRKW